MGKFDMMVLHTGKSYTLWISTLRPAATFVNYLCNIKISQYFGYLGITFIVIFPCEDREPLPDIGWRPMF